MRAAGALLLIALLSGGCGAGEQAVTEDSRGSTTSTTSSATSSTTQFVTATTVQSDGSTSTTSTGNSSTTRKPTTSTTVKPTQGSGVFGTASAGPTCPVERADQPCPPQPVDARIDARNASGATVASTHTDGGGNFALNLAPGRYTLVAETGGRYPYCPPTDASVTSGQRTRADIHCDTGIR